MEEAYEYEKISKIRTEQNYLRRVRRHCGIFSDRSHTGETGMGSIQLCGRQQHSGVYYSGYYYSIRITVSGFAGYSVCGAVSGSSLPSGEGRFCPEGSCFTDEISKK